MGKFIWLIGENLGNTANNNGFYFWRHVVQIHDDIDKFYILAKSPQNIQFYNSLDPEFQKWIVWRNSLEHLRLYFMADMLFVTLSFRDVRPEQILWKKYDFKIETPVVYLQHGTTAIKKLGYTGKSYNNNFFRFVYYNSLIKDELIAKNDFREYQLYYGQFHPRYQEMVIRNDAYVQERKTILWFITWREYLGNNISTKKLFLTIEHILTDSSLQKFLQDMGYALEVCFHNQFDITRINEIFNAVKSPSIRWVYAGDIDVMDELIACKYLISDYSSVGFDATLLNKPVLMYLPDLEAYSKGRQFYCSMEELKSSSIFSPRQLINTIISDSHQVNPFFRSRIPDSIDYEYIRAGRHIDRIYHDFSNMQHHKVTFVGYNFYGIGGTVFATRAMAEALLEKGYMVQLLSLKKNTRPNNIPYGLNLAMFYDAKAKGKRSWIQKTLFRSKRLLHYLKFDKDRSNLIPYVGYALKKWMTASNSETVISTRESLHPFLYHYGNPEMKKIYYFHCPAPMFDTVFPNLTGELKKIKVSKAIFVTDNARMDFLQTYSFTPYERYLILGNPLDSSRMICRREIQAVVPKDIYYGIYLLRISSDRKTDIENLLNYGRYLKEQACQNIVIDVFGTGDYVDEFLRIIIREELSDYIHYCGQTSNPKSEFSKHDAVVDFSVAHSFGMPYIEGVLNGKMVFCMRNPGSEEVMSDIPDSFIDSYEDLTQKILHLPERTLEELTRNYDIISERFSREALSDKLLEYIRER